MVTAMVDAIDEQTATEIKTKESSADVICRELKAVGYQFEPSQVERLTASELDDLSTRVAGLSGCFDLQDSLERLKSIAFSQRSSKTTLRGGKLRPLSEIDRPESIIRNAIPSKSIGLIFGDSQAYKSFLAVHAAVCIATGRDFAGRRVKNPMPVFFIAGEGYGAIEFRFHAAFSAMNEEPRNIYTYDGAGIIGDSMQLNELVNEIASEGGGTVIFDTYSQTVGFDNPESNEVVSNVYRLVRKALMPHMGKGSALIIHHNGHGEKGRARGGIAFNQNADFEIEVVGTGKSDGMTSRVNFKKMKDGKKPTSIEFELERVVLVPEDEKRDLEEVSTLVAKSARDAVDGLEAEPKRSAKSRSAAYEAILRILRNDSIDRQADGEKKVKVLKGNGGTAFKLKRSRLRDMVLDDGCLGERSEVTKGELKTKVNNALRSLKNDCLVYSDSDYVYLWDDPAKFPKS